MVFYATSNAVIDVKFSYKTKNCKKKKDFKKKKRLLKKIDKNLT